MERACNRLGVNTEQEAAMEIERIWMGHNAFGMLIIVWNKPWVIFIELVSVAITMSIDVIKGISIFREGMASRWMWKKIISRYCGDGEM